MRPTARLRVALRAALRRRYAYAALRVLRRGLRAALELHWRRSLEKEVYASHFAELVGAYWYALKALERRFGRLPPFDDPRARL